MKTVLVYLKLSLVQVVMWTDAGSTEFILKNQDLVLTKFQATDCGVNLDPNGQYYRYLQPSRKESDKLYVGAMNYLFQLDINNLTCVRHKQYTATNEDLRRCTVQGKREKPDCQNHIRVVMEMNDHLFICGTAAYAPTKYFLDNALNVTGTTSGIAICPYDPFDNYTAILVTEGNPGNAQVPYFGTYIDFIKNSPMFYRPPFTGNNKNYSEKQSDREDIGWLNYPQFVGSFDDRESVLFFFRETALEYVTSRNKIYSRVGRVCKHDLGGGYMDIAKKKWLSFQKARLICSLPGQSPYYFDDIYDVFESGDRFYALFYKQGADLGTSAICIYNKEDIMKVFRGKFKRRTQYGLWETVPDSDNPNPRLDNCTAHEKNPDIFQDKVSTFQLMDQNVDPVYGRPVFYKSGIQLNNIVVTETKVDESGNATNIYASATDGEIYDIFLKEFLPYGEKFLSELNIIYRPFDTSTNGNGKIVWDMKILNNKLYFGTDYEVRSMDLVAACRSISKINLCMANTHCKWKNCNKTCVSANVSAGYDDCQNASDRKDWKNIDQMGILHSIRELVKAATGTVLKPIQGLYVTVKLDTKYEVEDLIWTKEPQPRIRKRSSSVQNGTCENKQNILEDSEKFASLSNGDLIIKNLTTEDGGLYTACDKKDPTIPLAIVLVEPAEDTTASIVEVWKQQFNEWSTEFKKWKTCANTFYTESCPSNSNG